MPTNGIHLVLGISGICPFLPAPSATLLSPTVLVAVSYRRLSFSHFVFSSYSICMYFVLVHNSNKKKANSLHFVYPCVCLCLYHRVLQDYAYAMWVSYTKNSTLYYVVYYVCFDKLCKWHARDAFFRVEAAATQMLFFGFASPIVLLPIVLPASLSAAHSLSAFS